jgi:hypothetical protein
MAPACDIVNPQALGLQPGGDPVHVISTHAKSIRELIRRKPAMIVRRSGILLFRKKQLEGRLRF